MIRRFYLALHDRLVLRPGLFLGGIALLLAASLGVLTQLRLDMSFRPLFADDPVALEQTREFEAAFGQRSGAFVGVILQSPRVLSPYFVRRIHAASSAVEATDHVTEVISLARLAVPDWSWGRPRGRWLLPPEVLEGDPSGLSDEFLGRIAADSRARRVLSADGTSTVVLARVDLPLQDLAGRREVIRRFRAEVSARFGSDTDLHFVGVSVVEDAYAGIVLRNLARSLVLTVLSVVLVLALIFRRFGAVVVAMAGVSLATPVTLAVMVLFGQKLTMINSMVPTMILILGVADAIHMQQAYLHHRRSGRPRGPAVRAMFSEMAVPCLLTAVTTAIGFLSLSVAHIGAIRDFGLNVGIGVVTVYLLNLVLIPVLLSRIPDAWIMSRARRGSPARAWTDRVYALGTRWPLRAALVGVAVTIAAGAALPGLELDQRFNEEVKPGHPVRVAQGLFEKNFGGFLGPEISLVSSDGSSLLSRDGRRRIRAFAEAVRDLPGVLQVESVLDYLPVGIEEPEARGAIDAIRGDPLLGRQMRDVVDETTTRAAIIVRTDDLGTRRARELGATLGALSEAYLAPELEARVLGQWWLAQMGMQNLIRDMLASFATSLLFILPVMALVLRRVRLFLVSLAPNLLPMFFALAFMAWSGITVRIGTAMILAIALGIAIDDTIHFMVRLRDEVAHDPDPRRAVEAALRYTGPAMFHTTLVLVLGFLSMLSTELIAIRDMGIVAAATLVVALAADVVLAPALFLLLARPSREGAAAVVSRQAGDVHAQRAGMGGARSPGPSWASAESSS